MSAATILFTDIVGFSRKPSAEQLRLVKALKALVADELGPLLNAPAATRSVVALPTGDGVALAFLHLPERPWNLEKILRLILGMQTWAGKETAVSLRVGVHVGAVELVTDINGNSNVCGDTINYAQRVMDAANPKQVLFSDAAFREYIGAESRILCTPPFSEHRKAEFVGPFEVHGKRKLAMLVYKMNLKPKETWWSNKNPVGKRIEESQPQNEPAPVPEINSGVGTVVGGDVHVEGGDFIGRDKVEIHVASSPDRPEAERPEVLLQAYNRAVAEECRRLPLGIIGHEFVRADAGERSRDAGARIPENVPMPDIYVDLDVTALPEPEPDKASPWRWRAAQGLQGKRAALLDVLSDAKNARASLVGDAGSGKTTFVNYLAYSLLDKPDTLPESMRCGLVIRLVLREVAARCIPADARQGTAGMLWEGLRLDMLKHLHDTGAQALFAYFQNRLLAEGGFILLDGLDEVPEAQNRRKTLLEAVRMFVAQLPAQKTRVLLTARPYAYADPKCSEGDLPVFALAPFDQKQSARFIERFYQAVWKGLYSSHELAQVRSGELAAALKQRAYLADLGSRPLLLTLMATLHASGGQLPEDTAALLEETSKLLLWRWQRAREVYDEANNLVIEPGIAQCLNVAEDRIPSALQTLALKVHERQRGDEEQEEKPADISRDEVVLSFEAVLNVVDSNTLLKYLNDRAGLLIPGRDGLYAFPHRLFQEYLAACELLDRPDYEYEIRDRVYEDPKWWREVYLLAVGKNRKQLGNAFRLIHALLPESVDKAPHETDRNWRAAALAGMAIVELRFGDKDPRRDRYAHIITRCRSWLERLVEDGRLSPRERAKAGDVLGQLGDPRFDPASHHLPVRYRQKPEPRLGFVEIPAGPFVMGSRKGERDARDNEYGNPAKLEIPYRYWIGRYQVTVAQYALFMDDRGYEAMGFWTTIGWRWRGGEYDSAVKEEWLREHLKQRPQALRGKPMWWDEQRRFPNRPVYGVSWFEAAAYAKWLNAQLSKRGTAIVPKGYAVRLPTEAEWEKAARSGDARRYPWDDTDWDEDKANIEGRIGHATAVGSYPKGATPSGIHDMAGNVWEWTGTLYRKYPYKPEDGRNDAEVEGERVLRGGSWIDDRRGARCADRGRDDPDDFDDDVGFRGVVSLANSGF